MAVALVMMMIGLTFWGMIFLLFKAGKAAGDAAKTVVTERPAEAMNWIKFFVDIARK